MLRNVKGKKKKKKEKKEKATITPHSSTVFFRVFSLSL